MRDLQRAETITGDFLLVSGDVVSNISLEPALAAHRARREKDKNAIMTIVLREAGVGHRTGSKGSRPVFVIDCVSERCVHYEETSRTRGGVRHMTLDPDILTSSGDIEVRGDLIDCRIDICTQDVLLAWADNFDFTSVRKSFLRGVLKDYETYGKTVHTCILSDGYAARVKSFRAYNAINEDIRARWAYPLCPDSNLMPGQSYQLGRGKNYQEVDVHLSRTAVVRGSVIGRDSNIGDGSNVTGSTVGRRCKLGKRVTIEGAYIWDDVTIDDDTVVRQAILANGTSIGKRCTIESGALISTKVRLPDNVVVSAGNRVTKENDSYRSRSLDEDDSDTSSIASSRLVYQIPSASSSVSSISTLASSGSDMEPRESSRRGSFRSDPSDDIGGNRDFHLEARASILDGLQKHDPADTIILELNGYRMSTNASQHEVRRALVAAFMQRTSNLVSGNPASSTAGISAREAVQQLFGTYKALIERTMFDQDADLKVDQVDFLMLVQKEASGRPGGDQLLLFIAKEMYDLEILEEDGVLQWWEDERSQNGEMGKVRGLTLQFITFLQTAEEDEESEEQDEDDDDGD
jgi:translation initiation factor eIF-2B subunit epsilon